MGSIPFGLILTKIFLKKDIREVGSGNIGATNVLRTGNKSIGYIRANDKNKPYLSWAIMSKFRGNDLGSISLKMFLKKIDFKTCFALVDERNIPSLIMVIKNNFKFKSKNKRFILFQFKR